jgi:alkyl sulfatase BDS1-like metallo-beta-lactamase superfamily hydrolase
VQLPERFNRTYFTQQFYGLVEHHVRQIQTGLIGWFDGVESSLFPMPPLERANRLIAGFGGRDAVQQQSIEALAGNDVRWALELATWLVRSQPGPHGRADGGSPEERAQLAAVLHTISQRTTSANIRNWCATRALELEGRLEFVRLRGHSFRAPEVAGAPENSIRVLRVLLDPDLAKEVNHEFSVDFGRGIRVGLHIRRGVAVPTSGEGADTEWCISPQDWGQVLAGKSSVDEAFTAGKVTIARGHWSEARTALACFDHPSLSR